MFGLKKRRQEELDMIENRITIRQNLLDELRKKIDDVELLLKNREYEIQKLDGIVEMIDMGIEYTPIDSSSDELEIQINELQEEIAKKLSNENFFIVKRGYRIDNSEAKGRKFQKEYFKNLMIGLEGYIAKKEKAITTENYDETCRLIMNQLDKYNKSASMLGFGIDEEYAHLRIAIINYKLSMKIAKQNERDAIKEEKRRIAEEEKLRIEAEKEKARLIAEKSRWEKIFGEAMTDAKREEAKVKLEEISNRDAKIDYRLKNIKSGWVYIISNPIMPGIIKCGCTRRLDFTCRVDELSAAGVPFDFIVNCVTFSDDCFALESALHARFDKFRTNKINKRKEFFNITPEEAINIMKNEFNCDVHFMKEEE